MLLRHFFLWCVRGGEVVWEVGEGRGMMMAKSCGFVSAYHFFICLIKYWVNYFAFYGWTLRPFCHTASCLIDVAGLGLEIHRMLILNLQPRSWYWSWSWCFHVHVSYKFLSMSYRSKFVDLSSRLIVFLCACDFIVSCFVFFIICVWLYTLKIILTFPLLNTYLASQRSNTQF